MLAKSKHKAAYNAPARDGGSESGVHGLYRPKATQWINWDALSEREKAGIFGEKFYHSRPDFADTFLTSTQKSHRYIQSVSASRRRKNQPSLQNSRMSTKVSSRDNRLSWNKSCSHEYNSFLVNHPPTAISSRFHSQRSFHRIQSELRLPLHKRRAYDDPLSPFYEDVYHPRRNEKSCEEDESILEASRRVYRSLRFQSAEQEQDHSRNSREDEDCRGISYGSRTAASSGERRRDCSFPDSLYIEIKGLSRPIDFIERGESSEMKEGVTFIHPRAVNATTREVLEFELIPTVELNDIEETPVELVFHKQS